MKAKLVETSSLCLLLLITIACNEVIPFDIAGGKAKAQTLTVEKIWVVSDGLGSNQSSECIAETVVHLDSASGKHEYIAIHKSNPQLADYLKLKGGDRVSFEGSANPVQEKCASGAFVVLKK